MMMFSKPTATGSALLLLVATLVALGFPNPSTGLISSSSSSIPQNTNSRPYEFHVAPMQAYTNAPLRHLFRLLSPDAVLWTEMEKIRDLNDVIANNNNNNNNINGGLQKRFGAPNQEEVQKLTLQLGGNDPKALQQCVASLCEAGYHFTEINLNAGCPSIEAGGADFGASLMKQPDLTRQLMEAIRQGSCHGSSNTKLSLPPPPTISLKCRTAVFETAADMESVFGGSQQETDAWKDQQFQSLCSYISHAQQGGIQHVALHARPAVLAGLSSTKNRLVPPLDYALVERIAVEFPDLRVTLNGGIASMQNLDNLMERRQSVGDKSNGVASHMAGRWILQHPLALPAVQNRYLATDENEGNSNLDKNKEILGVAIEQYMRYVEDSLSQKTHSLSELCLPLYLVIEELRDGFDAEDYDGEDEIAPLENDFHANAVPSEQDCYDILKDALELLSDSLPSTPRKAKALPEDINWKKLSTFLKSLVGTKVYNKWKRNRNEL